MRTSVFLLVFLLPVSCIAGEMGLSCGPSERDIPLHQKADKNSPEIARLNCTATVWTLETAGGWTKVRADQGDGYIMTASLQVPGSADPQRPAATGTAVDAIPQQPLAPKNTSTAVMPTKDPKRPFPRGAAFFIEEMDEDLDGFLRAEIVKERLPMRLVLSAEQADFILTGASQEESKRTWHEGWLTPMRDHDVGNITAIHRGLNELVWASEAGDRSLWWGALKRGGIRKVADRLTNNLKDAIAKQ